MSLHRGASTKISYSNFGTDNIGSPVKVKKAVAEMQKKGKKRMKQIGNVEVPQKAFLAVLKLD